MLVSHRHKFIYTKTAKTAGTSVEAFFERFCMEEGEWEPSHARSEYESPNGIVGLRAAEIPANTKWFNHMSAAAIRKQLGEEIWSEYFKFCVIRNPFDKCISAFEHLGRDYKIKRSSLLDRFRLRSMSDEQRRFYEYVKRSAPMDHDNYLINGNFCLDDVIRYESLEDEIQRICKHLSLPFDLKYLPTYKKGYRRPNATLENLYTAHTQRLVEETYTFEINYFGYKFPDSIL